MSRKFWQMAAMSIGDEALRLLSSGTDRRQAMEIAATSALAAVGRDDMWPMFGALPSFSLAWAQCGFPIIEPSHKLCASLMCTSMSSEDANRLVYPWRCFGILVPDGLVDASSALLLVCHSLNGALYYLRLGDTFEMGQEGTLGDYCNVYFEGEPINGPGVDPALRPDMNEVERRAFLDGRLIVGVHAEMETIGSAASSKHGNAIRRKRGAPKSWVFRLTRDVRIDARSAVREYAIGRGKSLTIQCLVRGHWKSQPHGPGLSQRKLIHIEPYWRGPEDAPIAVRSHKVNT